MKQHKYDQYREHAVYSQSGWNEVVTGHNSNSGLSCLIPVIIAISLIAASLFYFGLF